MIRSRKNPKIQDIRRLRRSKDERALLEGPRLLDEALAAGIEPEQVLATPAYLADPAARPLLARLSRPPLEVAPAVMNELAETVSEWAGTLAGAPARSAGK